MAFSTFRGFFGSANTGLTNPSNLYTWGNNGSGQTAQGTLSGFTPFITQAGSVSNWTKAVANGGSFGFAQRLDGTLWAWGSGSSGQTGLGSATTVSVPNQTALTGSIVMVASSTGGTGLAIKSDGTLWSWGTNSFGATGQGTTVGLTLTPTQVGTDTDWAYVAAGDAMSIAIKTNGTMWATGTNANGRTGQNTTVGTLTTFTQIGTDTDWATVACETGFCFAIKTNGTLYSWGNNTSGQTAQGITTGNTLVPTQVGVATNWSKVECGQGFGLALRTDGTMWSWGNNNEYRTGRNTAGAATTSPAQIGTATGWTDIAAGLAFGLATRNDKTLWAWGNNDGFATGCGLNSVTEALRYPTEISPLPKWNSTPAGGTTFGAIVAGTEDATIFTEKFIPKAEAYANIGGGTAGNVFPIQGSSTEFYAAIVKASDTAYAAIVSGNGGYTSFTGAIAVDSITPGQQTPMGARIDDNNFLMTYTNAASFNIQIVRVNNTSGTLSVTAGPVSAASVTNARFGATAVLSTVDTLVFAGSSSSANHRLALLNTSTLSSVQNSAASAIGTATALNMIAVSSTLAAIVWNNGSNIPQITTIDVVSGTSFTINTAVSSGVTIQNGSAMLAKISTSKVLMVYQKGNFALAARTVDLAAGGSVTYNTEYNIAIGNMSTTFSPIAPAGYGTNFITGYYDNDFLVRTAITIKVTGNVIEFSTNNIQAQLTNNATVGFNTLAHEFVPMSSTQVGLVYQGLESGTIRDSIVSVLDLTATMPTWTGINSNAPINTLPSLSNIDRTTAVAIGGNRVLFGAYDGTTNALFRTVQFWGSTFTNAALNAASTTIGNVYPILAKIGYNIANQRQRAIACYRTASTTITTGVVSVTSVGDAVLGTTTTFSLTGTYTNAEGESWMMPLSNDSVLYVYRDSTALDLKGTVITSNALAISSTGTIASIFAPAGQEVQSFGLTWYQIDPTRIIWAVKTKTTSTGLYNLQLVVVTISGTTMTAGTPVNVYTGYTNDYLLSGVTILPNGITGIVTYGNDVATNATSYFARGFTVSGSSITLGSASTLATGISYGGKQGASGNQIVAVSPTQAVCIYNNAATSRGEVRLLTLTNINSISAGTAKVIIVNPDTSLFLLPGDNGNNLFAFGDISGGVNWVQLFRG